MFEANGKRPHISDFVAFGLRSASDHLQVMARSYVEAPDFKTGIAAVRRWLPQCIALLRGVEQELERIESEKGEQHG